MSELIGIKRICIFVHLFELGNFLFQKKEEILADMLDLLDLLGSYTTTEDDSESSETNNSCIVEPPASEPPLSERSILRAAVS